jgi:beta-glucanase (GH16 family)
MNLKIRPLFLLFLLVLLRGGILAQGSKKTIIVPDKLPNAYANPAKWQLLWHDEFDSTTLNATIWWAQTTETPRTLTYFTPREDNVAVRNGNLDIILKRDTVKNYPFSSGNVYSARLVTVNSRVEAAFKIPKGNGLWPCFWLFCQNCTDSTYQEVDIAEFRCRKTDEFDISNHFWRKDIKRFAPLWRRVFFKTAQRKRLDLSEGYHKYACEWLSDRLSFYFDDILIFEITENIPTRPMHLILSMGIGGNDGDPSIRRTVFPAVFSFDYVRVYATL